MEKRKAITMLIARYRADVVALKQREEELLRQIEIIGNLIPTATISYMSRSIRAGQMLLPHQEVEEAKERLEYLKHALTELQQSFGMVRKEAEIMNKRIVELETKFIETNYQYTNDMRNSENLNVWNEPYVKEDIRTESLKERVKNKSSGLQQRSAKVKIQEESLKPEVIKEQRENFDFEQSKYTYEPKQHSDKTENNTTLISDDPKSHGNLQKTVDVTREKNYKNVKTGGLKDKGDTFEQLKQSQRIKLNETSSKGKLQHEVKIIDTTLSKTQHSDKAIDNSILKPNNKAEQSDKIGYVIRKSNEKPQCAEIIDNAIQKSNDKAKQSDKIDSVIPKSNEKPQRVEIIDNVIPKSNGKDESLDKIDNEKVHCSNMLIGHVIPKLEDDQHAEQIGLMTHHDIDDYNSKKIANTIAKSEDVNQCSVKPTLSSDDVYVRILQEITDGNNDNEKDFNHPVLEDKISTFAEMLKITDSEFGNNPNETGNTCSKSGDPSNQRFSPQISNVTSDKIREAINKDNIIYQSVKFDEIQEPVGSSINQRPDETDYTISPPDKIISSVIPNTDNVHNELLNMLGRPSSIPIPEEQEFKIPLQATDENGKFVENYDELLDVSLKFEELLKSENTNWKEVYEKLSIQINELNEHLINSSQKINLYNEYVKHLEEKISILENELKVKIEMLEHRKSKHVRKSGAKIKQDMNKTLTTELSLLGEGEGVTPAYMQLAHWRFALKLPEYQGDKELKEKLMNGIKQGNMAPYYKEVCADLGWKFDSKLYDEMSAANVKRLEELEKDHENNVMDEEDQSQLCGVWQSKLDYLCSIGDRENASALANSKVDDKTVPKSHRIDAVFSLFRISFFHGCNIKGMSTAIEKATELIEGISGGDWSARNKLKAYEGVWSLAIRDFTRAAHLFVDVVPTFESYELADFGTIIRYTVLSCMIALPRCDLRKKLMLHGVMAQALHSQYQDLREYFVSLYDGRYSDFLVCLARIEVEMKRDPLLHPHYRHYVQEMRLRAYKQILQAYRSLSLDYMAQSFGVTSEFIEREVARFAAAGRLQCKIDSVAGTVITSAHLDDSVRSKEGPEASLDRNILYQTTVKRGDILLNRLKKLARVMDF